MSKPPISVSPGKPADADAENAGGEGAKSPLKKPLGLSLRKPGAALLQASACAPTADDLRVRPVDCQSAAVRITLGCENCG
jgi:hypothetical protein